MKAILALFISLVAVSLTAAALQLISAADASFAPSASAGGDSTLPVVSPDGRFLLFASTANNLALPATNTPYRAPLYTCLNVYLRDRASNTTVLVSANIDRTGLADRDSIPIAVSTNGQYVLFESAADNLVPNVTNTISQVFVRDVINGLTTLVSVNTNGAAGNGNSYNSTMTPDARYVSFTSAASNLVPGDTNGISDVFVRDLQGTNVVLVSVGAISSSAAPPGTSDASVITPDGRYVAFYSSATNLIPGLTLSGDVYVRDLVAGTTTWASTTARGFFQWQLRSTNAASFNLHISDDGTYVAFETCTNPGYLRPASGAIIRYNLATGFTDLITTNAFVQLKSFETIQNMDMSPDGRFITYVANINSLGETNTAIYLWDAATGTNTLISADTNGAQPSVAYCDYPGVSSNGQYVAFFGSSPAFATNTSGNGPFLYLRNVAAGTTTLVNGDTNGYCSGNGSLGGISLSPDGRFITFASAQSTLVPADFNRDSDVFLFDAASNATELISARQPSLSCLTADGPSMISSQSISQDGHYLAFASDADDIVPGDTNLSRDVFVRDLFAATNSLVSIAMDGSFGNANSSEPALSGNGRFVAFTAAATNLVPGDTNNATDVFVRDLQNQTTELISVDAAGTGQGNTNSYTPTISTDGRYVMFLSQAKNLTTGTFSGTDNLFLRDRQAGATFALTTAGRGYQSMTADGHFIAFATAASASSGQIFVWDSQLDQIVASNTTPTGISAVTISPDGNRIACFTGTGALTALDRNANQAYLITTGVLTTHNSLHFNADGRFLAYALAPNWPTNQVFLYDFLLATNILVSHDATFMTDGNASSDSPDISADGRFIVYRSDASNLVTGDTNNAGDIFLYDTATGTNTILSTGIGNIAADNGSFIPRFSGDGHTLVFATESADFGIGDYNQIDDLFAYPFLYATASPSNGGSPNINWPAAPGQTYTVEYKDNLSDPVWQPLPGSVTIVGNRGYLTDSTLTSGQRFYRIVQNN